MIRIPRWTVAALALAVAACGGGGGGSSGGGVGGDACAFLAGPNCWKTIAAAATSCTNGSATGAFDGPATNSCTYADGVSVDFDPAATATASIHQDVPWDFTVLTSTATTCAHYSETDTSMTLVVPGVGTFSESWASGNRVDVSCADGSTFSWDMNTALNTLANCPSLMPGWKWSSSGGTVTWSFMGTSGSDSVLWSCH